MTQEIKNEFKILVTGGRDYNNRLQLYKSMDDVLEEVFGVEGIPMSGIVIIHGAAKGADNLADEYGINRGFRVMRYPADWKKYGRAAGPIRNGQMLTERPDIIVAFPGGAGTANMTKQGERAGVRVIKIDH